MAPDTPERRKRAYVHAQITLVTTDAGGRATPFASGYRPQFWLYQATIDGHRAYCDAEIFLECRELLRPGETAKAWLAPSRPDYWDRVRIDDEVEFYEGARLIGTATVLELHTPPAS
jgi:translation elongation factor EF-Tu-like GTPase